MNWPPSVISAKTIAGAVTGSEKPAPDRTSTQAVSNKPGTDWLIQHFTQPAPNAAPITL